MIVARQFIVWKYAQKRRPVPEGRSEPRDRIDSPPTVEEPPLDSIIPSLRDGSLFGTSQAINCLATIISPSGTKTLNACSRIRCEITTDRAPPFYEDDDEDEDDYD
jgi:hypothetical protein